MLPPIRNIIVRRKPPFKVLAEGDSITQGTTSLSYADRWGTSHPSILYKNNAVGGAQTGTSGDVSPTNTLFARQAAALAYRPTHQSIFIAANDLGSDTATYIANLKALVLPIRSAGTKVFFCTALPRTVAGQSSVDSGWEAKRGPFNTALRAGKGVWFEDLVDFDTTTMGVAGAEGNATLYEDGLHPAPAGQAILARAYTTIINYWVNIPNEPLDFLYAPQAAATLDTDYDSSNYTVAGFYAGEARPYTVSTGGAVSKNNGTFVTNGSGSVVNGDTLKVRNHSSVSNATQTDVTLTIGATTATYSVTTAGAGSRDWIPTDLGSKLKLWLRPEDIAGANATQMATWPDNSGNSVTVTGAGASSNPTVVASGLNGFKTVKWDGPLNSRFTLPGGYLSGRTASATLFVSKNVADPPSAYFGPPIASWGTDTSGEFYPYTNGSVYSSYATNTRYQTADPSPSLASWRFASFHSGASDWRYYIDGVAIHTLTSNTVAMGSAPLIGFEGSGGSFDGQIAEIVDCNSVLTTTERQLVEGYLAWKFGLEANLPGGHPYAAAKPTI